MIATSTITSNLTEIGTAQPQLVFLYLGWELGWCLDSYGKDQNSGVVVLGPKPSVEECLSDCKKIAGVTGCEWHSTKCQVHTQDVASGNGESSFLCYVLPDKGSYSLA